MSKILLLNQKRYSKQGNSKNGYPGSQQLFRRFLKPCRPEWSFNTEQNHFGINNLACEEFRSGILPDIK